MWLLLTTSKIYFAGVTLARARLRQGSGVASEADVRARRVAWTPVAVLVAGLAIVAASLVQEFSTVPASTPMEILRRISDVAAHGAARVVLWPFVTIVQPLFAAWPEPYLVAVALAAVVLAATTVWVLQSDQAFEEAARAATERRGAERGQKKPTYPVP